MSAQSVVRVENVSKRFRLYHQRNSTLKQTLMTGRRARYEEFWALRDVSFEIEQGTTFGIIGQNGSGKSTLLKCVARILKPDGGSVHTEGRLTALLELGAGFHPEYTGRENIFLNGALLGLSRHEVEAVIDPIVEFCGPEVARFIDNPVKTYSSGMYARLGFSIAVHLDPDILVVDEILAVGDENFQRRCYQRIEEMKAAGKTLIMVSHALDTIRDHCRDAAWLERGNLRAIGPVTEVVNQYLSEVRAQEAAAMEKSVAALHRDVPSGREGVGVSEVVFSGPLGVAREFQTSDAVEVQVHYHSPREDLRDVRFELGFVREDGVLVFSTGTETDTGQSLPGTGVVTLKLPHLELLAGLYRLSVTIEDGASREPYTVLANAFPFRVSGREGVAERGVARLDHQWVLPAAVRESTPPGVRR
jgi:ABC-2 type transport system ATP-binding protein